LATGLEAVDLDRGRVMPPINAACPIKLAVNDGQPEAIVAATIGLQQALWCPDRAVPADMVAELVGS
jgi:hypothetical protein